MIRSRKLLVLVSAVVIFLLLLVIGHVTETKASACYELGVSYDCENWVYTSVLLHSDYTFDEAGGGYGDWGAFGKSIYLQFWGGCQVLFAGTIKGGFFECTDGSRQGKDNYPGCYVLKKSKACYSLDKNAKEEQDSVSNESFDQP